MGILVDVIFLFVFDSPLSALYSTQLDPADIRTII